jgi:hypothetical protein
MHPRDDEGRVKANDHVTERWLFSSRNHDMIVDEVRCREVMHHGQYTLGDIAE